MDDHDPQSFRELFDAEPTDPASPETARWVEIYQSLIAMMERQLEETRTFAERAPIAIRQYLSRENIAILEEELGAFKDRLGRWTDTVSADSSAAQSEAAPPGASQP